MWGLPSPHTCEFPHHTRHHRALGIFCDLLLGHTEFRRCLRFRPRALALLSCTPLLGNQCAPCPSLPGLRRLLCSLLHSHRQRQRVILSTSEHRILMGRPSEEELRVAADTPWSSGGASLISGGPACSAHVQPPHDVVIVSSLSSLKPCLPVYHVSPPRGSQCLTHLTMSLTRASPRGWHTGHFVLCSFHSRCGQKVPLLCYSRGSDVPGRPCLGSLPPLPPSFR